jgi:hypothetical protein
MQPPFPPDGLFHAFAPRIAALPDRAPLAREDLLVQDFLLWQEGALALYYAPFDYINERARVALVGIAPGWFQMELAHRTARDALRSGLPPERASELARVTASFSGAIRKNLVAMLDGMGLHTALGLPSSWDLFGERLGLLHTTAVVRYPLFVRGANWTGYTPDPLRHPLLRRFVLEGLAEELRRVPAALVVPLGKSVAESLSYLASIGATDAARCLPGLPHPSGANAHRHAQFAAARPALADRVRAWFG